MKNNKKKFKKKKKLPESLNIHLSASHFKNIKWGSIEFKNPDIMYA